LNSTKPSAVDASDYKQYIFPPVFFKGLSDVWDEEFSFLQVRRACAKKSSRTLPAARYSAQPS